MSTEVDLVTRKSESVVEEFVGRELQADADGMTSDGRTSQAIHGPLPLLLGVTGHRDIIHDQRDRLQEVLRAEFQKLKDQYDSTSLVLLTALAEGADQLAAQAALSLGLRLIVVMPLRQDLYELDYSGEALTTFRTLLRQAEHAFALPILDGASDDDVRPHGPHRDRQYAQLGAYLAGHSQILFALWDGVYQHKEGGTSQVVKFKLEGVPGPFAPPHSSLDAPDSGPVYHIITPRASNPTPVGEPHTVKRIYPSGFESEAEIEQSYLSICKRMDTFNADAIRYRGELHERQQQSKSFLLPKSIQQTLPASLREALDFYAIADVLSQRYQKRTIVTLRILLWFVFGAAVFYDLYSHVFEAYPVVIGMYLVMFTLAFCCYYWAARGEYQEKYQDYRALAEGLRVQIFWKLADLNDSVADFYMRKQKSELDWIRIAVRSTMTETCGDSIEDLNNRPPHRERLQHVLKHWVRDQAKYFVKAAQRDHQRLAKRERIVSGLFVGALALAAIQVTIHFNKVISIGIGLFPVAAALLHTFLQKNAYAEHSKQYARMGVFFKRAEAHLEGLLVHGLDTQAQHFLAELGREALVENGDWLLTHRERPLEVPKG